MSHFTIIMDTVAQYRTTDYGILYESRHVFSTTKSHSPTRVVIWNNTHRPNPDRGKQLGDKLRDGCIVTKYSTPGITERRYIDPQGKPTDEKVTILLSPESTAICADTRLNTGQPGSGQVYAQDRLDDGDTAKLILPDGTNADVVLHFPRGHNGHGYATFS